MLYKSFLFSFLGGGEHQNGLISVWESPAQAIWHKVSDKMSKRERGWGKSFPLQHKGSETSSTSDDLIKFHKSPIRHPIPFSLPSLQWRLTHPLYIIPAVPAMEIARLIESLSALDIREKKIFLIYIWLRRWDKKKLLYITKDTFCCFAFHVFLVKKKWTKNYVSYTTLYFKLFFSSVQQLKRVHTQSGL